MASVSEFERIVAEAHAPYPRNLLVMRSSHERGSKFQVWGPHDWPEACGTYVIPISEFIANRENFISFLEHGRTCDLDEFARHWALEGPR